MASTTKSYTVLSPIRRDGKDYAIGNPIALDDAQFEELRATGAIDAEPVDDTAAPQGRGKPKS
jgi:hypothetical protein